jgi:hypothetical protein
MLSPENLNASIRAFWRAVWPALVPMFAFVLFSAQIAKWLSSRHYSFGLPMNSPFLILVPLVSIGALTLAAIFSIQRRTLLQCPNCMKLIYPNQVSLVIATKRCTNCGEIIVATKS